MKKGLLISMFSFVVYFSCANDNPVSSTDEKVDLPTAGYAINNIKYFQKSDTLVLVVPNCNCIDTVLDNSAVLKLFKFSLKSDTLSVKIKEYTSFKNTGFNVEYYNVYKRMNKSTDIVGYWEKISMYNRIIKSSDTVSVSQDDSNSVNEFTKSVPGSNYDYLHITSNTFEYYTSAVVFDFANSLIETWDTYFNSSAGYKFFVQKLTSDTVMISSQITKDSLKVFVKSNGDKVWQTNSTKYPKYINYAVSTPENCPNNLYPLWIKEFAIASKEITK